MNIEEKCAAILDAQNDLAKCISDGPEKFESFDDWNAEIENLRACLYGMEENLAGHLAEYQLEAFANTTLDKENT